MERALEGAAGQIEHAEAIGGEGGDGAGVAGQGRGALEVAQDRLDGPVGGDALPALRR